MIHNDEIRARNVARYRSEMLEARLPEDELRAEKSKRANRRALEAARRYEDKDEADGDLARFLAEAG